MKKDMKMEMREDDEVEQLTGEKLSKFELAPFVVAEGGKKWAERRAGK